MKRPGFMHVCDFARGIPIPEIAIPLCLSRGRMREEGLKETPGFWDGCSALIERQPAAEHPYYRVTGIKRLPTAISRDYILPASSASMTISPTE